MSLQVPLEGIERVMANTCVDLEKFAGQLDRLRSTTTELARFNANFRTFLGSMELVASCNAFPDIDALSDAQHAAAYEQHTAAAEASKQRLKDISDALVALSAVPDTGAGGNDGARGLPGARSVGAIGKGSHMPSIASHFDLAKLPPKFHADHSAREALFRLYEGILDATRRAKSAAAAAAAGAGAGAGNRLVAAGGATAAEPPGVTVAGAVALTRGTTIVTNECLSCLTRLGMVERVQVAITDKRKGKGVVFHYLAVEKAGPESGARAGVLKRKGPAKK